MSDFCLNRRDRQFDLKEISIDEMAEISGGSAGLSECGFPKASFAPPLPTLITTPWGTFYAYRA